MSPLVKDAAAAESSEDTRSKASASERSDVEASGVNPSKNENPYSIKEEEEAEGDDDEESWDEEEGELAQEEDDDQPPIFEGGRPRGKVTGPVSGGGKPVTRPPRPIK